MKTSNVRERLLELMAKYGIRQKDIAKRTGLNKATISYYVSGKREPAQDNIFIIAKAFNVDPAWLMGYDFPTEISPEIAQLCKDIMRLTPQQQQSVANLVRSMLPN